MRTFFATSLLIATAFADEVYKEVMSGSDSTSHQVILDVTDDIVAPEGYDKLYYADVSESKQRVWWRFTDVNEAKYITYRTTYEAGTVGWVGVGLSDNGGMKGLDACIASRFGDQWTVEDYWFLDGFQYVFDTDTYLGGSNECTLVVSEQDGLITFEITKEVTSCDEFDSQYHSAAYLLLAWSDRSHVGYHGKETRGGAHVELYGGSRPSASVNPVLSTMEFKHTFDLEPVTTQFWCVYKEIDLDEPFYISHVPEAFGEPWYSAGYEGIVHHIQLYNCPGCHLLLDDETAPNPGESFRCDMDLPIRTSHPAFSFAGGNVPIATELWVPGVELSVLPDNMSTLLFTKGKQYVMHELHIENPNHLSNTQEVVNIYENVGPQEITSGRVVTWTQPIKLEPGHDSIDMWAQIPSDYFEHLTNSSAATVHGIAAHMHKQGKSWEIFFIRNGTTVYHTQQVYDFNLQTYRRTDYDYQPGDSALIHWTFDTSKMTEVVYVGDATDEEMAQIYFKIYPLAEEMAYHMILMNEVYQTYEDGSQYMVSTDYSNPRGDGFFGLTVLEVTEGPEWMWPIGFPGWLSFDPEDTSEWKVEQTRGGHCMPGAGAANPYVPVKRTPTPTAPENTHDEIIVICAVVAGVVLAVACVCLMHAMISCCKADKKAKKIKNQDDVQEVEVAVELGEGGDKQVEV